jgi:hypothetical protein
MNAIGDRLHLRLASQETSIVTSHVAMQQWSSEPLFRRPQWKYQNRRDTPDLDRQERCFPKF